MSRLFTARREDGIAEWRLVYDAVKDLEVGGVVTYDEICSLLGRPRTDLTPIYRLAGRVGHELRCHDQRSLESVPSVGYRVLHPKEHELQARRFQRSSRRKLRTSLEVVRATDLRQLDPAEQQRVIALGVVLHGMCAAIAAIDRRQRRTEEILAGIRDETDQRLNETQGEVVKIKEALAAAGLLT